ncbi:MAG: hypothetical protein EBR02_05950 [Alphaproteobacteria bacterium]|nr:hypothetical protein [Alphaproteobacteria bacterium]
MSKLRLPLILISCVGLLIYLRLGFIFMFFAFLPSMVSYYIDRLPQKPTFKTVLACNLGTAIHPIADMLSHGVAMSHDQFSEALGKPQIWLFIYMGAAAGWGLVYACHFVAHFTVQTYHEYQLYHLKQQQDWLASEWGNDVKPEEEE